eukprot:jgi/Ulvmu1/12845/UM098_0030.1
MLAPMPCLRRASPCELASSNSTHRRNQAVQLGRSRITRLRCTQPSRRAGLVVRALDAAMPFDFESRAAARIKSQQTLKVGIVGFGTFGQFLAKRMVQQSHQVIAVSRADYSKEGSEIGVKYFSCMDDFAEEHPDVVILASSILSTKKVLESLPLLRFKRNTLFVDVLSVKVFPKQLLLSQLPPEMDIICTHPMFGPDSGKEAWTGLNFQYELVRINGGAERQTRAQRFLKIFESEGCNMVEMTCEAHDQLAANTQFVTHTVGRLLGSMGMQSTSINTRGYESLLSLVDNTANDSFDLYYGLFMYNQNSTETLQQLEAAFDEIKEKLFTQLHQVVREQIFPPVPDQVLQLPANATPENSGSEATSPGASDGELASVGDSGTGA